MGNRPIPFLVNEWYHCYSRGIDKCVTFIDESDYWYFLESAYMANRVCKLSQRERQSLSRHDVWKLPSDKPLVSIAAYCLMPNHFHFLIKEITPGGLSVFMQRLGTSYTMFFNRKYSRSGGLFTSPFRSKHIADDRYLQTVIHYIHMNPLGLLSDDVEISDKASLEHLSNYQFSSLLDYEGIKRQQGMLLSAREVSPHKSTPSPRATPLRAS